MSLVRARPHPGRLLVFVMAVCALIWLGCGDDVATAPNAQPAVPSDLEHVDVVGIWKLTAFEPHLPGVDTFPQQTFTLNVDGTWESQTVLETPGAGEIAISAEGTYTITGDQLTGSTTTVEIHPAFDLPLAFPTGFVGAVTVQRDGDRLIVTQQDDITGDVTITVYQME